MTKAAIFCASNLILVKGLDKEENSLLSHPPSLLMRYLSKTTEALNLASRSNVFRHKVDSPPAIFSAKRMTIWVKLTGPGASETIPWASPSEMERPTEAKAAFRSLADKRPS